ncbi:MAG: metallophosphoesterase family protein [Betaproteobacteria bacterium]|nr:MAG: metallophosphoesterase family protein [Betaproteobacteria bacterium]
MAVYGVLGDIHGNVEALEAVLAALDDRGVRRLLCVGDVVGYNADPDACVALLRARGTQVIAGNHDLIGTGRLGFERCSNKARYSLQRTRRRLAPERVAWLTALPANRLIEDSIALVHGGVRDVQLYMTTPQHIRRNAALLREDFPTARVCFFGHSHEQRLYEAVGDEARQLPNDGLYHLSRDRIYFINAGSVDAQRKRERKLAEFSVFDSDAWTVQFFSVRYDAASTEAKATVAGYRIGPLTDWIYTLRRRLQFI